MKTAVRTWFSDRWASRRSRTSSAYWRTLPMLSMGKFLVAAFITWCAVGFVIDLLLVNYQPLGRGFFWPIYFGTLGTALFAARMRRIGLVPVLLLITGAGLWLGVRISFHSSASPDLEAMHHRVVFDAIGILVGTIVGYRLLVDFIMTEGLATVRIQTELALAHGIQATLVPTLSLQVDRFEVYGKSIPSAEMGGDLIDAVERDGTLLAYVADISGHGLAAGQLMGMLKTADGFPSSSDRNRWPYWKVRTACFPRSRRRTCTRRSRFCTSTARPKRNIRWQAIRPSFTIAPRPRISRGSPWSSFPWA